MSGMSGPLRVIVDWAPHFSLFGFGAAILSCGHEKIHKRGTRSRRTRCVRCLTAIAADHPRGCRDKWPDAPVDWCSLCREVVT